MILLTLNFGRGKIRLARDSSIALRAQLLKKSAWLLHVVGGEMPHTTRDSGDVARVIVIPETADSVGI